MLARLSARSFRLTPAWSRSVNPQWFVQLEAMHSSVPVRAAHVLLLLLIEKIYRHTNVKQTTTTTATKLINSGQLQPNRRYRRHSAVRHRGMTRCPGQTRSWPASVCQLVVVFGCLTSQQHGSVSQGRICSDKSTCHHTQKKVTGQTCHLTQSQYTDTGPTSPSVVPLTSGSMQDNH